MLFVAVYWNGGIFKDASAGYSVKKTPDTIYSTKKDTTNNVIFAFSHFQTSTNTNMSDFPPDAPQLSGNSSLSLHLDCWMSGPSISVFLCFSITNILIIFPLSTFILHLGWRRWRKQRSVAATTPATSHSDMFTYHVVAMEIIAATASFLFCVGTYVGDVALKLYSSSLFVVVWSVKIYFHALTCVECYLAVVHPIAYRGLKNTGGVKIRNGSIGCVWLLCFGTWGVSKISHEGTLFVYFFSVALVIVVVCFCCLSVLCALKRPRPGGERVDQSKKKAFHTIVTIMSVLLLCSGGMLVCDALVNSPVLADSDRKCLVNASTAWLTLPSDLVLPLLFLQRAGKLPRCRRGKLAS